MERVRKLVLHLKHGSIRPPLPNRMAGPLGQAIGTDGPLGRNAWDTAQRAGLPCRTNGSLGRSALNTAQRTDGLRFRPKGPAVPIAWATGPGICHPPRFQRPNGPAVRRLYLNEPNRRDTGASHRSKEEGPQQNDSPSRHQRTT